MGELTSLDLFSGIGGFALGLEWAGVRSTAFCEIDPFARDCLARRFPKAPIHEDVAALDDRSIGRVDIITGGFPCQDVSIAGDRRGLDGERSGLWAEMRKRIGALRPRWVVVENTTGLLDLGMGRVLGDLAALGYDAVWHCIPASAVGAAHDRDRVWIIAYDRRQRRGERSDGDGADSRQLLQDFNRQLALSLERCRIEQSHAHPFACLGARIPDGREARTAYLESALCRKADGLPGWLDRLRCLGNAVVPQIPFLIASAILSIEEARP